MRRSILCAFAIILLFTLQATAQHKKKKPAAKGKAKKEAASKTKEKESGAKFVFKDGDTHDFGNIPSGPDVSHSFTFTNAGNEPLIIQDCNPSCNCTTPTWPKQPILPGKTGAIKLSFHTNHPGPFTKQVSILSNSITGGADKRTIIYIKGTVTGDAKASTPERK